ncbi:hypothetical protein X777_08325 [Ooceraea biroi]|uniref:Uncharacterized protein n=1 Tax=Ooceraea biroi TaxID=2015173 RepID=A0A026WZ92_OOCBI|nr:hypothetical protein X777_08325 [Ooceraea biroi]
MSLVYMSQLPALCRKVIMLMYSRSDVALDLFARRPRCPPDDRTSVDLTPPGRMTGPARDECR